jgi:(2R)-3-sulfolactate dehydrogenase (NADP+)
MTNASSAGGSRAHAIEADVSDVKAFVERVLIAAGARATHATQIAASLVTASQYGRESQGLARLSTYVRQYAAGGITPNDWRLIKTQGPIEHYDGRGGSGHVHIDDAGDRASHLATRYGIGLVGVSDSNHCGTLSVTAFRLAEAGFVALLATNAPAVVAPPGGREAVVGTNPIAIAAPTAESDPIVCDLATSQASRGAVLSAAGRGASIPLDWALAADGRPTADPNEALRGTLLPLGGVKGFALAVGVEILTGVLFGPRVGSEIGDLSRQDVSRAQGVAHVVLTIAPQACADGDGYLERAQRLCQQIKDSGTDGSSRVPGERISRLRVNHARHIVVAADLLQKLNVLAKELHVEALRIMPADTNTPVS